MYIIFLICVPKGGSNEYPQSMFWGEIWKYQSFLSEIFQFLEVIFFIYLNRRVSVMVSYAIFSPYNMRN